ncbi:GNAT family N-acetyltransferase [Candidatus Woesearchaeota archaeon]|nr:GNAT family N-acetyltransferase [Candidatus Woesearchaeota archaeon]
MIRQATRSDISAVRELHAKCYAGVGLDHRIDDCEKTIIEEPEKALVIELSGRIMAFGLVCSFSFIGNQYDSKKELLNGFPYTYPSTEISRLLVDPEYRRRRYGTEITKELEKIAAAINSPFIYVGCIANHSGSQDIFYDLGYTSNALTIAVSNDYSIPMADNALSHYTLAFKQNFAPLKELHKNIIYYIPETKDFTEHMFSLLKLEGIELQEGDSKLGSNSEYENLRKRIYFSKQLPIIAMRKQHK